MSRTTRLFTLFAVLTVFLGGIAPETRAQNAAGRIIGNVTDPSGASVTGATVTVTNIATQISQQAVTDKDGYFQALAVPIGTYSVAIEKDGFQRQVFDNQVLQINQSLRVDAKLSLGSKTEVVEVRDQADNVETVNPTIGASITGRELTDMPLNGRNVLNLALMQPGVTPVDSSFSGAGTFNIGGGRADSVTFLLDGGLNNEQLANAVVFNPNPDTVAEFRILENNYTAEYGRNGGGIITEVIRSGTNEWHGSAFDFIRNDAFNANDYFHKNDPNNLLPRDVLKRNQFGGTFGGPVFVPKLVHGKDRFFFFVGYQGQRQTQQQSINSFQTFTPAELTGDFSQAGNGGTAGPAACPNRDPNVAAFLQANPFFVGSAGNAACAKLDPARINSVAQKYIAAGLIPTAAGGFLNAHPSATNNDNELTMKFDFNVTQKDRLAVTLGGNRNPIVNGAGNPGIGGLVASPGYPLITNTHNYFSNFAYTHTFSSNLLNEFRVTVQRFNQLSSKPATTIPTHTAVGEIGITPDLELGAAALQFTDEGSYFGFSIQGPSTLISNTYYYGDVLSWTRGRHNMKFGGNFSAYQFNTAFDFIGNGLFQFQGAGGIGSGNDFADFLFGLPTFYNQSPNAPTNARSKFYAGFGQDEWRVNKNLVLTVGVRYEYSTPKLDTHGFTFNVIPGLHSTVFPNAPNGLVFPGDKGAPRGVNFPDRNNFAPRFGFAWDPQGNSKTSIRGGFGVFYDILKAEDNFQDNGQPPFFAGAFLNFSPLASNPTGDVPYLAQPFTSTGATNPFPSKPVDHNIDFAAAGILPFGISSIFLDDPHLRTPYTYQYNLSVQREIARNTTVQLGYLGSSSHGLTSLVDINPFPLGGSDRILNLLPGNSSCTSATFFDCSFSNLLEFKNVSNASYNGLTASITRQVTDARGIGRTYFTLGYTYSHSIDNASGFRARNSQVPTYNPGMFRASSDFDIRNRVTFGGGWDLPFDRAWSSGPKRLTQGWSLYPIVSWRTGFPLDVFAQTTGAGDFTNPGVTGAGDIQPFANLTGQPATIFDPHQVQTLVGPSGTSTGNFYFNPAAFTNDQVGVTPSCLAPSPVCFPSPDQVVANPSLRTYGTAGRAVLRGPGRTNIDMTLAKTTSITERLKLEIRVDAFNLFNHTEFGNPSTNITSSKFGRVTTTGDPGNAVVAVDPKERVLQLAARFTF
ncbi:MAG TPA: carboxypeptidase regulatory-like domain-containing protein [Candidatus Acidoferrum sp.]|nr:carboxypeptidase regulatory-like domain-containing protein [Candidatus Acidoferrum sp.]